MDPSDASTLRTAAQRAIAFAKTHWLGLAFALLLGAVQLCFYDITFHGPDQIRDVEIARQLVHHGVWPLNSPPLLGGRVFLPPGFYYFLAIPLAVFDQANSVFLFFGTAFILSVIYAWKKISSIFGAGCGALYVVFAFPLFPSIFTHSAWNPALTMTLSSILLGLFLEKTNSLKNDWHWLIITEFLLIQIHPSGAPLILGLLLYIAFHRKILSNIRTILAFCAVISLIFVWLYFSDFAQISPLEKTTPDMIDRVRELLANLTDVAKWQDAAQLSYQTIRSIQPSQSTATVIAAVYLGMLGLGCLTGIIFSHGNRVVSWVCATTALWLIASMAFLERGAFWYMDPLQPWISLIAAYGLVRSCDSIGLSKKWLQALTMAFFTMMLAGQINLYSHIKALGKVDLNTSLLYFPKASEMNFIIPGYTYRYLNEFRNYLLKTNVCSDNIVGIEAFWVRDLAGIFLEKTCEINRMHPKSNSLVYYASSKKDEVDFVFADSLIPVAKFGTTNLYAVDNPVISLNGVTRNNIRSREHHTYVASTYAVSQLKNGIHMSISAPKRNYIVRATLRCNRDDKIRNPGQWNIRGGKFAQPMSYSHKNYLGLNFYDLEWHVHVQNGASEFEIYTPHEEINCDVSVVARPSSKDAENLDDASLSE